MRDALIARLGELGLAPPADDYAALDAMLDSAKKTLLAYTGQDTLPQALEAVCRDMAAGEYLFYRKHAGLLDASAEAVAVKQLQQGDTSVTYAVGETGSPMDMLIEQLRTPPQALIARWRRLVW